jgi:hypothetical protein
MKDLLAKFAPIIVLLVFSAVDNNIPRMSEFIRLVLFGPLIILDWTLRQLHVARDYRIVVDLLIGMPLIPLYWVALSTAFMKWWRSFRANIRPVDHQ